MATSSGSTSPSDETAPTEAEVIVLHHLSGCTVERHPSDMVIKSGRRVKADEAEALRVAVTLGLPVPRVHRVQHTADGVSIYMDYVPGQTLDKAWPAMSAEQKTGIAVQLCVILSAMRAATPPANHIGACGGGPARDLRRIGNYAGGPFTDEASFNSFILDLLQATPTAIRKALTDQLDNHHRIVFTHGDLGQKNIMVNDSKITGLIDWEYAGYYPEHWEYVKFFERFSPHQDWKDYAQEIFPQTYEKELVNHIALTQWQLP